MKRKKAVFTNLHNEPAFFPLWLQYYQKFFEPEDIYVIHLCKPKPVPFDSWLEDQMGFVRIPTPDLQTCNFQLVVDRVQALQRDLLQRYECVLFAEADEFVVHMAGLSAYIDAWATNHQVEVCNGFEIVHKWEEEPRLDLSAAILPQRKWWYHSKLYSKPLLTRIPLTYCCGFHHCQEAIPHGEPTDPNLLLLHLQKVDYDICVQRRLARFHNEDDSELAKEHPPGSASYQTFIRDFNMKHWWTLSIDDFSPVVTTEIPEYVRQFPL